MAELPQYQRTILRQTQETDMSEANVWKTLAAQMDNFSSQIGSYAQADIARKSKAAAAQKAELRYQTQLNLTATKYAKSQLDSQTSKDLTATKYAKSQQDAQTSRDLAADKYAKSQSDSNKTKLIAAEKYLKSQSDKVTALELTATKYAETQENKKIALELTATKYAATQAKLQKTANDAARKLYLDDMEISIIEAAHKAAINNPKDYQGYLTEFDAQAKVWLQSEALDDMQGAKELLATMIEAKRQHYGEQPYEASQQLIQEDGIASAEQNLEADVNDYIHQAGVSLDITTNVPVDADLSGHITDTLKVTENQWQKMTAKIEDYVVLNGQAPEVAAAFEIKMQEKYIAGVVGKQIIQDINNNDGTASLLEFYTDPNKFIRTRKYLSPFIPQGITVSEALKESIYDELNTYLADYNKALEDNEKQAEDALIADQLDNFIAYKSAIQTGSDLNKDDLRIAHKGEIIDGPQYTELLDDLATGKYKEEDETVKWELLQDMLNPALSVENKIAAISQALTDKTIHGPSAGTYLTKAYSANKVTSQEGYSLANGAIGRAFGVSSSGMNLFPQSGLSKEDTANMRYAQEELYRRVDEGEVPIEIYNEIIEKYTNNDAGEKLPLGTIGNHTFADSYTMKSGFNTYFVGTPEITEGGATTLKIGKDLDEGLITEAEATRLSKSLKAYIKIQRGLN